MRDFWVIVRCHMRSVEDLHGRDRISTSTSRVKTMLGVFRTLTYVKSRDVTHVPAGTPSTVHDCV